MSLLILALIVFVGAFAQSVTGLGFGVIAGPFLLLAYGYDLAIAETAVFSLVIALIGAARLFRFTEARAVVLLTATLPIGVVAGLVTLSVLPKTAIVALFGCVLGILGVLALFDSRECITRPEPIRRGGDIWLGLAFSGVLAGAGALLFAAPGPAAAWGLSRTALPAKSIRSTLAVYFVPAYVTVLIAFAFSRSLSNLDIRATGLMVPICLLGAAAGIRFGDRFSARALRFAIGLLITASGISLFSSSLWKAL